MISLMDLKNKVAVVTGATGGLGSVLVKELDDEGAECILISRDEEKLKALVGKEKTKQASVEVYMDSELVMRQLNNEYKLEQEKLFPFFIKILNLKIDFGRVIFHHVPREENKDADAQVNAALDREQGRMF